MNKILKKCLCLLTALCILTCAGCSYFELSVEEQSALQEETVTGVEVGQELAATYAGDKIFSLNCVLSDTFNPYKVESAWNEVVCMLVYEPLIELDGDFEPQPCLVTAWDTEDGLTWTFSVDTGRGFHDGGRLTSYDCVYSIVQAWSSSRYGTRFADIESVFAVGDAQFVVQLKSANYSFYKLLNIPCIEYDSAYESMPPGTGPYKFGSTGKVLTVYADHPEAENLPLERIYLKEYTGAGDILQAFEDSYIDLAINNPTAMSNLGYSSASIKKYADTSHMHYLGYNMKSIMFGQASFRAFMTYAINRSAIVSDCMGGAAVAAALPIHPNNALYPTALAKLLGYSSNGLQTAVENLNVMDVDGDGVLEVFSGVSAIKMDINFIVCSDSAAKVAAARSIAQNLENVGFSVNLRELSYSDYVKALEDGDFDVYYAEVKLCGDWDLSELLAADGSLNYGNVQDVFLQGYLKDCKTATEDTRQEKLDILYQYIAQQAPITVILFEKTEILYHRGVITGLSPTQDSYFNDISNWTVTLPE